jgi:hypothetical protein
MEISIIPKYLINLFALSDEQKIDMNIFFSSIVVLFLLFPFINTIFLLPHFCIFQKAFGISCPACGILRSIRYLSNMDILASIHSNPLGIGLVVYISLQIPFRLVSLLFPTCHQKICKISNVLSRMFIVLLLSLWVNKLFTIL